MGLGGWAGRAEQYSRLLCAQGGWASREETATGVLGYNMFSTLITTPPKKCLFALTLLSTFFCMVYLLSLLVLKLDAAPPLIQPYIDQKVWVWVLP